MKHFFQIITILVVLLEGHESAAQKAKPAVHEHSSDAEKLSERELPKGNPAWIHTERKLKPAKPWQKTPGVDGAFRTRCFLSHYNYDDPIVFPGQKGKAHLHVFFGGTAVDADTTYRTLLSKGGSTCAGGTINRTAYWMPAMLDGNNKPVPASHIFVYYKPGVYGSGKEKALRSIPDGLKFVAGDAKASKPQRPVNEKDDHDDFGYFCINNEHPNTGKPVDHIPKCKKGYRVIARIIFPQCWDGKRLDSKDHRSHVVYPRDSACPASHPVPIPEMTYFVDFPVTTSKGTTGWHLSSDMYDWKKTKAGYSLHADWIDGWDRTIKDTWFEKCVIVPGNRCDTNMIGNGQELEFDTELAFKMQKDFKLFRSKIRLPPSTNSGKKQ